MLKVFLAFTEAAIRPIVFNIFRYNLVKRNIGLDRG